MSLLKMKRTLVSCKVPDIFFELNQFRSFEIFFYVSNITCTVICPERDVLMYVNRRNDNGGIWNFRFFIPCIFQVLY